MHNLTNHAWNVLKGIHGRKSTTVGGEGGFSKSLSTPTPTSISALPNGAQRLTKVCVMVDRESEEFTGIGSTRG